MQPRSDTCRAGGSQARLTWPPGRPRAVFLVRKRDDDRACRALVEIGTWLQDDRKLLVVVEEADVHRDDKFVGAADRLADVDLVVCLGGDGTLLHVSSLFQGQCCPPVVAFAMGTLGFLTPMNIADARCQLTRVLGANAAEVFTTLRMRLWCDVYRKGSSEPELRYQVLNECLIDRGGNAVLTCLDLFVDGELVTVVQADGIIVSTPTGSTAYSMSAGGSIVAPTVHGILITPVCPHTLSFRPAVIPDSSVVRIRVSDHTRARTACASFDGTHRTPLNPGDEICLSMSAMPIPTVNDRQFNTDWFASIVEKLHWNVRVPCAGGPDVNIRSAGTRVGDRHGRRSGTPILVHAGLPDSLARQRRQLTMARLPGPALVATGRVTVGALSIDRCCTIGVPVVDWRLQPCLFGFVCGGRVPHLDHQLGTFPRGRPRRMLLLETVDALAPYTWLLVFAGVIAFALAIGIGANDVSNTFGSAVGAGTLSLRQAVVIACVFELLGSVLLGGKVSALIKEKLIDHDAFKDRPDVLLLVLVAALISSAAWLLLATFLRLPVSTTHTVVGSVLGAGVVAHGLSAIRWTAIGWIVAAWFLSPVLTCLLATVAFRILRQAVLRQDPRLSLQRANRFIPALAFVIAIANVACISVNAAVRPAVAVPVALVVGVAAACTPSLFTRVIRVLSRPTPAKLDIELEQQTAAPGRLVRSVSFYEHVAALHERAEHFPAGTERALSTVQCLTAMFNAFTHGSNDVSNSVGLFSAVVTLFQKGTTRDHGGIPPWILSVGGVGISLGLVLFGHRLMSTMGKRLSKITPSRGIVIDVTSAFIVMLASQFGITVSSTQCVVGSTIGVGAAEGVRQGVNWRLVLRTVFGWIGTLVVSSLTSAAIFSFAAFTPSAVSPTHG